MAKLRIDAGELLVALDDHSGLAEWYLDRRTGEVLSIADESLAEGDEDLPARVESDPGRYLLIEPFPSSFECRLMAEFAEGVNDAAARAALEHALADRKPFRAFKDALLDYPAARERWFRFKNERCLEAARAWLEAEGIEGELVNIPVERDK